MAEETYIPGGRFLHPAEYAIFDNEVRRQRRHVLHDPTAIKFLKAVRSTAKKRTHILSAGVTLWRAQIGCDQKDKPYHDSQRGTRPRWVLSPFGKKRMYPLTEKAKEGRVNPKGIPCFYGATDSDTAMAEMRPWIGTYLSVARLQLTTEIRCIDCSKDWNPPAEAWMTPKGREALAWYYVNQAYARPITVSDDTADYAPTQYLAEVFRHHGFEGIIYKSGIGPGNNIAIFDPAKASFLDSRLFWVDAIGHDFKECDKSGNPKHPVLKHPDP